MVRSKGKDMKLLKAIEKLNSCYFITPVHPTCWATLPDWSPLVKTCNQSSYETEVVFTKVLSPFLILKTQGYKNDFKKELMMSSC